MVEKTKMTAKESEKRIVDLKIELLKNPTKRKSIKREIARLLTMKQMSESRTQGPGDKDSGDRKTLTKLEDKK